MRDVHCLVLIRGLVWGYIHGGVRTCGSDRAATARDISHRDARERRRAGHRARATRCECVYVARRGVCADWWCVMMTSPGGARADGDGDGVRDQRLVMRRDAIAATTGDAMCAVRALVSASERVAIGERLLARDGEAGGERGGRASARARTEREARSDAGERSVGRHAARELGGGDDGDMMYDNDCDASGSDEEDAREEMVTEACARVKRARGALGLDVFDFETSAAAHSVDIALSDDDLDDILAQVEYSSNGWETHAERSATTVGNSVGGARTFASAAPVGGTQSQMLFSQIIVESQVVDRRDPIESDDDESDDRDDVDTESEEDNHAGGTQMMFSGDFEDQDEDEAPGATQCAEDIDAEFTGGTQVFNESDDEDARDRGDDDAQTPPSKLGTPSFLRINSGSLALPHRASGGVKRVEIQTKDTAGTDAKDSPGQPKSLWSAASCTPAEETARRESAAQTLAEHASIPPNLALLGTEPQRVANTQLTTDVANDSGITEPCSNVENTPLEAMEQARKPPTLKRPRVLQTCTQEDSMVTASARALGSIGTEDRDGVEGVQRVARTAIEAIQRARAKANEPLGLDMSMPQDLMDSQAVDDEDKDKDDRIEDDVPLGQPVEGTNEVDDDDNDFNNAGDDDFGPDAVGETPPSSPDLGLLYSQRPAEDVASPGRLQTQLSQSPMKPPVAPPMGLPMGLPLSQSEVESPVSRIMMSQHQWRQKKHRRSIPPPPRFDEETPTRRVRIIDDDLTQPTQTQPTQDSFEEHSDIDGDFIEQTQDEGGLLRPILPQRMPGSFIKPNPQTSASADDQPAPTTSTDKQQLPSLGCSKCRYSKGGCGRCRMILENAKKGIFPPGRGRRSSLSSTPSSKTNGKRLSSVAKTPASKTPTSKRAVPLESCRLRAPKSTSEKKSVKAAGRVPRFFADAYFLLSGLGKSASSVKDAIRTHGGTILDVPSSDVPVNAVFIITPTLGRTMKCLYGFSAGVKFATPEWIEACVDANTMIDIIEPLDGEGQPRKRHRATSGRLFRDIKTALTGNEGFVKDFASLLAHAGAELESNPQTTIKFDYLIVQSGEKPHSAWIRASKRLNIPCVRHEWLVESILAGEMLHPEPFIYLDATPAAYVPHRESIDSELSGHRRKSTRY